MSIGNNIYTRNKNIYDNHLAIQIVNNSNIKKARNMFKVNNKYTRMTFHCLYC